MCSTRSSASNRRSTRQNSPASWGIAQTSGVLVYAVTPRGPADQAHIQPGDALVRLAGKPLETVEDLFSALRAHRPGQTVAIELVRTAKRESVEVNLSSKPQ